MVLVQEQVLYGAREWWPASELVLLDRDVEPEFPCGWDDCDNTVQRRRHVGPVAMVSMGPHLWDNDCEYDEPDSAEPDSADCFPGTRRRWRR